MSQNAFKNEMGLHEIFALITKIKLLKQWANSQSGRYPPEQRNKRTELHNEREGRNISLSECEWRWKGQPPLTAPMVVQCLKLL